MGNAFLAEKKLSFIMKLFHFVTEKTIRLAKDKQNILAFSTVCQQLSLAYQSAERFQWTLEQWALIPHSPHPY
jgi:hypothetical protein